MAVALLLVGVACAALGGTIFTRRMQPLIQGTLNNQLFDTLFGYQPAAIARLQAIYAGNARLNAAYRQEVWWDNRFVLAYSAMFLSWWLASMLAWGGNDQVMGISLITLGAGLALLGGIADLVENWLVATALNATAPLSSPLVVGLSIATNLKWVGTLNVLLLALVVGRHLIPGAR